MIDHVPPPSHYEENIAPSYQQQHFSLVKQRVFEVMGHLHGWCSTEKAGLLMDLIFRNKPKVIVEIGVWGGKSLLPMAYALRENGDGIAYGIDPWASQESVRFVMEEVNRAFWEYANHEYVLHDLVDKIGQLELQNQIRLIKSTSEDAPPIYGIDVLHIDGNHSHETSFLDVTKWVPYMNSGGWIIFDDMKWHEKGVFTTAFACSWLDEHCYKLAELTDVNCTWGIWIKP